MGGMVRENLVLAAEGMLNNDVSQAEKIRETENVINFLNHGITDYLVQFSGHAFRRMCRSSSAICSSGW